MATGCSTARSSATTARSKPRTANARCARCGFRAHLYRIVEQLAGTDGGLKMQNSMAVAHITDKPAKWF
jgi:hypothetical protein